MGVVALPSPGCSWPGELRVCKTTTSQSLTPPERERKSRNLAAAGKLAESIMPLPGPSQSPWRGQQVPMSFESDCSRARVNKQRSQRCVLTGRQRSKHPSCLSSRLCQGGASESWNRPVQAWDPSCHAADAVPSCISTESGQAERADAPGGETGSGLTEQKKTSYTEEYKWRRNMYFSPSPQLHFLPVFFQIFICSQSIHTYMYLYN